MKAKPKTKREDRRVYANTATDTLKNYFIQLTRTSKDVKFIHEINFIDIDLDVDSFLIKFELGNQKEEKTFEVPINTVKYMKNSIFDYLYKNYGINKY